jgi:hypothetical protein
MATAWDPSDVETARESSRRIIALLVVGTFAASVLAGYVMLWGVAGDELADRADVAVRIGAPVVAIVGTVIGFYFGRETE